MRKLYTCKKEGCNNKEPILSKGLCRNCYIQSRGNSYMKKDKKAKPDLLRDFYKEKVSELQRVKESDLDGSKILNPSHFNIAHILPKRKVGGFPSISTHPSNCLFLTTEQHATYDYLLDKHDFDGLKKFLGEKWEEVSSTMLNLIDIATERNKLYLKLANYLLCT